MIGKLYMEKKDIKEVVVNKIRDIIANLSSDEDRNFNTMKRTLNFISQDKEFMEQYSEDERYEVLSYISELVQKELGIEPK